MNWSSGEDRGRPGAAGIGLLVLALLAPACRGFGEEEARLSIHRVDASGTITLSDDEVSALDLRSEPSREGSVVQEHLRFGAVVVPPGDDVLVVAPVSGRLIEVRSRLGAEVSAGDELLILSPTTDTASGADLSLRAARLEAELAGSAARVRAAEADQERITQLVEDGLATPADAARAEAALATERSLADGLRRSAPVARQASGGRRTVVAPVGGTLATLDVDLGALVPQGAVLARVVRPGARWVDVELPLDDPDVEVARVRTAGRWVPATRSARGVVAEGGSHRLDRLEVAVVDAGGLLPDQRVAVRVGRSVAGLLVPSAAVLRRDGERLCFVDRGDHTFVARAVRVRADDGTDAVVEGAIEPGDRIVVQGAASLLGELGFSGLGPRAAGP